MHPGSDVILSNDIADSLVMEEMDDNPRLMIIRNAYYKHYLTIYISSFSGAFQTVEAIQSAGCIFEVNIL